MTKPIQTIALHADSSEAGQKIGMILGLPLWTAIFYASLFAAAFWFYSVLWPSAPIIADDSPSYLRVAQDLADFRIDQLNSRPPGYPLLLAFTGAGRSLFYTSLILHFVSVWLIAAVLCALGMRGMWLISLAVLLSLPPYVEYAAYMLSDNLSEFLLVVAFSSLVLWFLRGRSTRLLVMSGVAMACSGLTRPTYQILAFIIACFLLIVRGAIGEKAFTYRKCIKAGLILLTASIVFIGGFSLLNYVKFNFFGIYPMTGFNLSTRTVRFLERLPEEYVAEREALIKARDVELTQRDGDHVANLSYWKAVPELIKITGLEPIPELAKHMLHLNLLLIKEAPLHYLQEVFSSFSSYWLPSSTRLTNMDSLALQSLWAGVHFGVLTLSVLQLVVILGLAIFMFSQRLFSGKAKRETSLSLPVESTFAYFLAGTIVFYNALATSLFEVGDPRYRMPTEPLVIFMCFLGFYLWRQLLIASEGSGPSTHRDR